VMQEDVAVNVSVVLDTTPIECSNIAAQADQLMRTVHEVSSDAFRISPELTPNSLAEFFAVPILKLTY
jgi:hypothetical protein